MPNQNLTILMNDAERALVDLLQNFVIDAVFERAEGRVITFKNNGIWYDMEVYIKETDEIGEEN